MVLFLLPNNIVFLTFKSSSSCDRLEHVWRNFRSLLSCLIGDFNSGLWDCDEGIEHLEDSEP